MSQQQLKILLDMNMSPEWEEYLASTGIEAKHWSAIGSPQAADEEIIRVAAHHGFAILTGDLDFGILIVRSGESRPSVVQVRTKGTLPEHIGVRVIQILTAERETILRGALVTINADRTRVRMLSATS